MTLFPSDDVLIQQLHAQQPQALEHLYDRYGDVMYGLAFRILGDRPEAEDLIHDLFLKLWHRCTYDPGRGSFQSFLLLQVRSRALDRVRSRRARQNTAERSGYLDLADGGRSPLESVVSHEISHRVQEALAILPDNQRQALELSYFKGLTQQEIAQHLNVPLGTVKSYFRLSFAKLRQSLQDLMS